MRSRSREREVGVKRGKRGVKRRAGASGNLTGTEDGEGGGEEKERDGERWREVLL